MLHIDLQLVKHWKTLETTSCLVARGLTHKVQTINNINLSFQQCCQYVVVAVGRNNYREIQLTLSLIDLLENLLMKLKMYYKVDLYISHRRHLVS